MNFFGLFQGFFDITARSLQERHLRERRLRCQRIEATWEDSLIQQMEELQSWVDSRRKIRERLQEVEDSPSLTLIDQDWEAIGSDGNKVLSDWWSAVGKAEQQGLLRFKRSKGELAHVE